MNKKLHILCNWMLGTTMLFGATTLQAAPADRTGSDPSKQVSSGNAYYDQFRNPEAKYRPFVRWWWNGDKVNANELRRELHLLKDAGIGGVEINPVGFPGGADDLGIPSIPWLSKEWIDMLKVAFDQASKLDMTCDLIVGSGWPFGGEFLQGDERGQVMVVGVEKLSGPQEYTTSVFSLLKEADPAISKPYSGRVPHLLSLQLVPEPLGSLDQVIDLSDKINEKGAFTIQIPEGKYALYALVRIDSFGAVISGAPGAQGPTLNHLDSTAVKKYLNHMSDAIQAQLGPLTQYIRSLFTDSMELEGANWSSDFAAEFKKRRGYDIMPYLQYTMFKTGGMGNVLDYNYAVEMTPEFKEMIDRMRYDVELTKAEMFRDRFTIPYTNWCRQLGVKSRAQAYGRGFFPLESGMYYDIPEGESWTTNWLQHRIGEEMSNEEYRAGRAYTMVNKYITSAAHLTGKRLISAEEMTNTYRVFNATPEFLKIGSDQNAQVGITHSVWHGFNYSPPEAPFPGWVRYGSYYSEKNNWWRYFNCLNTHRARVASQLQNADMYADIAILMPVSDMWTTMGMQNEPFPSSINKPYQSLVWEAMNKNGNGTDYISEPLICASTISDGMLHYGPRSYKNLFLVGVESMNPETLAKLYEFAQQGGHIFCVETVPYKSLGWKDHEKRDAEVKAWIEKLQAMPEQFIHLEKPTDNDFITWYAGVQKQYGITPTVQIESPDPFVMANLFVRDDGSRIYFFTNTHLHNSHQTKLTFPQEATRMNAWVWNLDNGERYRLPLDKAGAMTLDLGPADARMIVFDRDNNKKAPVWAPLPTSGADSTTLSDWSLEFHHSLEHWIKTATTDTLKDLKDTEWKSFTGDVVYRTDVEVDDPEGMVLNLGKVYGVASLKVNGVDCGTSWYGRRIYDLSKVLHKGWNRIEVTVTTTMGNYLQTWKENRIAQQWTNRPGRPQPVQSMGMAGPVTLYHK